MRVENFTWTPGDGTDATSLSRLRTMLRRPIQPMGEAWFMGEERQLFKELLGDLSKLPSQELQKPLVEIASGISCFGPLDEWSAWYHFLLGELIPRSHEQHLESLLEYLITAFMANYPSGIVEEPYPSFKDDVLLTLGKAMMDQRCWRGSEIAVGTILHRSNNNPNRVWCWWDASGDFSSAMFFCLKYLDPALIAGWLRSVLIIPSPHWRAQLIVWLVGAHPLLLTGAWPSSLKEASRPSVSWAWAHCLDPRLAQERSESEHTFIPLASREEALRVIREYVTDDIYLDWLLSISDVQYLKEELAEIPSTFESLYINGARI